MRRSRQARSSARSECLRSRFCVARTAAKGLVLGYGRLHESAVLYVVRALEAILRPYLQAGPGAQPADLVTQGAG